MATRYYLTNKNIGVSSLINKVLTLERGTGATTIRGTTTASGTWISLGYWATKPLVAFTLSGSVSFNLRGLEQNTGANSSFGMRIYKYNAGSLSASLGQASATTELPTSEGVVTASVTPTSTSFANGDILVVEIGIINIGTMNSGRFVDLYFNGTTANASGDSYFTITENTVYQKRVQLTE